MKFLIVGSGLSASQVHERDYRKEGFTLIAVNHGWMACEDSFTWWIRSNDFEGTRPPKFSEGQHEVISYSRELDKFGGQNACGWSIALNAGYWALAQKPEVIAFVGCDMDYTKDENGNTHIYGVGLDIKKQGFSDPILMCKLHGKGNPNYLRDIYLRLQNKAHERGCQVLNASKSEKTRLPYPKYS